MDASSQGCSGIPVADSVNARYRGVLLGGTFDRLHAGHKSLLAAAVGCCDCSDAESTGASAELIVGVSCGPLLENKFLKDLILPYAERKAAILRYLGAEVERQGKAGRIVLTCVPIESAVPAKGATNPGLDCIVVSEETRAGADALNRARHHNGLPATDVVVVKTVPSPVGTGADGAPVPSSPPMGAAAGGSRAAGAGTEEGEDDVRPEAARGSKLSSSALRWEGLGTRPEPILPGSALGGAALVKVPVERCRRAREGSLGVPPYLIGLTGGIACGKSTVAQLLRELGAASVDCDRLAHHAYAPGTPSFRKIVAAFGESILAPDGSIDRAALGAQVFGNADRMAQLTGIVWPAVRALVEEQQEACGAAAAAREEGQGGAEVLVVEAAMMLEAGSQAAMDELWVVFVPPDVAKARLIARNGMSAEEAGRRMDSQMPTAQRIAAADVVLCNAWGHAQIQHQTRKAWALLQQRIQPVLATWHARLDRVAHPYLWVRWANLLSRLEVADAEMARAWFDRLFPGPQLSDGSGDEEGHASVLPRAGNAPQQTEVLGQEMGIGQQFGDAAAAARAFFQAYHGQAHFVADPLPTKLALFFCAAALGLPVPAMSCSGLTDVAHEGGVGYDSTALPANEQGLQHRASVAWGQAWERHGRRHAAALVQSFTRELPPHAHPTCADAVTLLERLSLAHQPRTGGDWDVLGQVVEEALQPQG